MKNDSTILKFQRECFKNYLSDIKKEVKEFPIPYLFPDGNPIQPVIPVLTALNKIMVVGAFPSARFERRLGKLIPVANNLAPFGAEHYFDGNEVRIQESTKSLYKNYFLPLGFEKVDVNDNFWVTDIVKVYLYPQKHVKNCSSLFPMKKFVNTHQLFKKIAFASIYWFNKELNICRPRLVITLGEIAARVVSNNNSYSTKELLNGEIYESKRYNGINMVHIAHPEIRRINKQWDDLTHKQLLKLAREVKNYI